MPFPPPCGTRPTLDKCHAGPQRKTKRCLEVPKIKVARVPGRRRRLVCIVFLLCLDFFWKTTARTLFGNFGLEFFLSVWRWKRFLSCWQQTMIFFFNGVVFSSWLAFFFSLRRHSVPRQKKRVDQCTSYVRCKRLLKKDNSVEG